jgi:cell division protein FtsL
MKRESLLPCKTNLCLIVLALVLTLAYVRLRINVYHLSYRINSNMKILAELKDKNKKLKIESASMRAPSRIGSIAQEKLKMRLDNNGKAILVTTR